jgi:hypothetical protein
MRRGKGIGIDLSTAKRSSSGKSEDMWDMLYLSIWFWEDNILLCQPSGFRSILVSISISAVLEVISVNLGEQVSVIQTFTDLAPAWLLRSNNESPRSVCKISVERSLAMSASSRAWFIRAFRILRWWSYDLSEDMGPFDKVDWSILHFLSTNGQRRIGCPFSSFQWLSLPIRHSYSSRWQNRWSFTRKFLE